MDQYRNGPLPYRRFTLLGRAVLHGGASSSIGLSWVVTEQRDDEQQEIGYGAKPATPALPRRQGGAIYNDGNK